MAIPNILKKINLSGDARKKYGSIIIYIYIYLQQKMIYKWELVDLIFDKYNDTIIKKLFSKFKKYFYVVCF